MSKKIIIIGAGIVGASIARELSKYKNFEILLLEKEIDVCLGVSKANTAILHAGYDDDFEKFPIRASLCCMGNQLWHELVKELHIPVVWSGSLVVARNENERKTLNELYFRGLKNGVANLKLIDKDVLIKMEPNITKSAISALFAPSAGIISPYEAVFALVENAVNNGAKLILDKKVKKIKFGKRKEVITNFNSYKFDYAVNAAGLYGDEISRMAGIENFSIFPRKGEYFIFDKNLGRCTNHILFPIPTNKSKGIVISFTVEGNTIIGPNAQDVFSKDDTSTTKIGLEEVYNGAKKLVRKIPKKKYCIRNFAGLRIEPTNGDFIIKDYKEVEGFINAVGTRSPGFTAAPAIAKKICSIIEKNLGKELEKKDNFNPIRIPIPRFNEQNILKKDELIKKNLGYGKIICRCEKVSMAEVLEAIKRGARTIDGVKFRTRAGMGRCQGGFCSFRVMEILAKELNISIVDIEKKEKGSRMVICETKDLYREEYDRKRC